MDDRIKQILGRFRFKQALDIDHNYKLNLEVTSRVIKNNADKIISILSSEDVFEEERLISTNYRILGRLNVVTDNTISYLDSGPNGTLEKFPTPFDWDPLFDGTPPVAPNNWVLQMTYPSKIDDNVVIANTRAHHGIRVSSVVSTNPSGSRVQVGVNCIQKHGLSVGDYVYMFDITSSSPYQGLHKIESLGIDGNNEETSFTLETVFTINYGNMNLKRVVNTSFDDSRYLNASQSISVSTSDISGTTTNTLYTKITTATQHNLVESDYVEIRSTPNPLFNGVHRVEKVVDNYNYVIRLQFSLSPTTLPLVFTYKRMDGTPSDYYARKFTVLTVNDYDIHKAAYGYDIYPETRINELGISNETWLFELLKDVDLGPLVDHRGGPISEIYFSTIKRAGQNTYNWSNVTAHWEFDKTLADYNNSLENISLNNPNGVGTIQKPFIGDEYYGDFVEYNRKEIREKLITPIIHRFSIQYNPSKDGYYYQPFTKVNIRDYSNEIEVAKPEDNVEGIPGNYELRPNGDKEWRDLLTPGFFEDETTGVDYPFLNGAHYIFINHFIYVRRQIPPTDPVNREGIITIDPTPIC
jgi:hypothetical protein